MCFFPVNKYPYMAQSGYCWAYNRERGEQEMIEIEVTSLSQALVSSQSMTEAYMRERKIIENWRKKGEIYITGTKGRIDYSAYTVSGAVNNKSYPVFFEIGTKEILDKLGYVISKEVEWAERNMTKTDEPINRFTFLDFEE